MLFKFLSNYHHQPKCRYLPNELLESCVFHKTLQHLNFVVKEECGFLEQAFIYA